MRVLLGRRVAAPPAQLHLRVVAWGVCGVLWPPRCAALPPAATTPSPTTSTALRRPLINQGVQLHLDLKPSQPAGQTSGALGRRQHYRTATAASRNLLVMARSQLSLARNSSAFSGDRVRESKANYYEKSNKLQQKETATPTGEGGVLAIDHEIATHYIWTEGSRQPAAGGRGTDGATKVALRGPRRRLRAFRAEGKGTVCGACAGRSVVLGVQNFRNR